MTIAAANFLAVLSGAAPAAGAVPIPAEGFSAAIGTALTDPVAEPLPGNATPPVLATELVSEAALVVGKPVPRAQTDCIVAPDPAQPETALDAPAPAEPPAVKPHDPDQPTIYAPPAPDAEPRLTVSSEDLPLAEPEIAAEDLFGCVMAPEPAVSEPVEAALSPVAALWVPQAKGVPPATVAPESIDIAQTLPPTPRPRQTTEAPVEVTHGSAASPGAPAFAERMATAAAPPPAGAGPAHVQPAPFDMRPAAVAAEPASRAAPRDQPTVNARSGQIGREMGVEIARHLSAGGEALTVRLNPAEMGRIEVRLSFDEGGTLRAVVAAESAAALDMLRRDSADLGRALTDAGVRADAGSFRFDSRSGGGEGGQFWQRQQQSARQRGNAAADDLHTAEPVYRPLRALGRVDLMA